MISSILYTTAPVDRCHEWRRDADRLAVLAADPGMGVVPLWRDLSLVTPDPARAAIVSGDGAAALRGQTEGMVFLGLAGERPLFACDLGGHEGAEPPDLGGGARFLSLRTHAPLLPAEDGTLLAYARGMLLWHRRQRFCGVCGSPTVWAEGGHERHCTHAACGATFYPRTDPAVIMMVEDEDGRMLLHRQRSWPAGMWSCLAGFVEPGETLEQAVAREVREESGILVDDIRYVTSQPWPFPSSLMVAFTARAVGGTLAPDPVELEDAAWFGPEELADFDDGHRDAGTGPYLSRSGTVARLLIDGWLARHMPG